MNYNSSLFTNDYTVFAVGFKEKRILPILQFFLLFSSTFALDGHKRCGGNRQIAVGQLRLPDQNSIYIYSNFGIIGEGVSEMSTEFITNQKKLLVEERYSK